MLNSDHSTVNHARQNIQYDCHQTTSGFLTALECTKFVFSRGLPQTGGVYCAYTYHPAGLKGTYKREGKGGKRERGGER